MSIQRRFKRMVMRKRGIKRDPQPAHRDTPDGKGYEVISFTKGWKKYSFKRAIAQRKVAWLLQGRR